MKFTTAIFTLISAAAAVSAAAIDTNESGLSALRERSFELKARHVEKRDWVSKWGKATWYGGNQLNDPACGGPTPNDNSMIAAVKKNGGYGKCGETVHLHYQGKMVSVKIVDYCASKFHFVSTASSSIHSFSPAHPHPHLIVSSHTLHRIATNTIFSFYIIIFVSSFFSPFLRLRRCRLRVLQTLGCEWGHFDLSRGAFKKLASIDQGVIEGLHFKLFTKN